jgi:hypothetical protein
MAARVRVLGALVLVVLASSCKPRDPESGSALQGDDSAPGGGRPGNVYEVTNEKLFDGAVNRIEIVIHGDTWHHVVGKYACDDEAPYGHVKEFIFTHDGETVKLNNVGLQVKGNTSCDDPVEQKGFKLKFNPLDKIIEGENGEELYRIRNVFEENDRPLNYPEDLQKQIKKQNLFGLKGIALRRGGNDPTRMRDGLSASVFAFDGELARQTKRPGAPLVGGPVFRGGLVHVRITNGFGTLVEGLYGLVELVDDDLAALRYGDDAVGNLFKIKDAKGTFLESDMPKDRNLLLTWYQPKVVDGDGYTDDTEYGIKQRLCKERKFPQAKCDKLDKQRKKAEDALRGFRATLTDAVSAPDVQTRRAKLQAFLDVDNILSYAVAANLTGHWDSLIGAMSNNDFLFMHQQTKKWGIIAWDLDNSFGAGTQNYPWMANLTDFGVDLKYRPLFQAVIDNFPEEYEARAQVFLTGAYDFDRVGGKITQLRDAVDPGSQDEKYENLFKFKNHRWGNAYCHLKNGPGSKVQIKGGWPVIEKQNGQYVAACEPR